MTTNRKLAMVMGKLTAEGPIKSLQNFHCVPELESVQLSVYCPVADMSGLPVPAAGR